ncbi:MAG: hypothetical protein KVP17_000822 [Porospora cf. gigantea B]|uniref:uncharacterized protein n=1 Tax=Porospora cf. gigantea B TaxID=2853592 RepID=UPI003571B18C|nr:MAG: hypothetical protein KVP17_000822 [Porospora cf. gigantea B]
MITGKLVYESAFAYVSAHKRCMFVRLPDVPHRKRSFLDLLRGISSDAADPVFIGRTVAGSAASTSLYLGKLMEFEAFLMDERAETAPDEMTWLPPDLLLDLERSFRDQKREKARRMLSPRSRERVDERNAKKEEDRKKQIRRNLIRQALGKAMKPEEDDEDYDHETIPDLRKFVICASNLQAAMMREGSCFVRFNEVAQGLGLPLLASRLPSTVVSFAACVSHTMVQSPGDFTLAVHDKDKLPSLLSTWSTLGGYPRQLWQRLDKVFSSASRVLAGVAEHACMWEVELLGSANPRPCRIALTTCKLSDKSNLVALVAACAGCGDFEHVIGPKDNAFAKANLRTTNGEGNQWEEWTLLLEDLHTLGLQQQDIIVLIKLCLAIALLPQLDDDTREDPNTAEDRQTPTAPSAFNVETILAAPRPPSVSSTPSQIGSSLLPPGIKSGIWSPSAEGVKTVRTARVPPRMRADRSAKPPTRPPSRLEPASISPHRYSSLSPPGVKDQTRSRVSSSLSPTPAGVKHQTRSRVSSSLSPTPAGVKDQTRSRVSSSLSPAPPGVKIGVRTPSGVYAPPKVHAPRESSASARSVSQLSSAMSSVDQGSSRRNWETFTLVLPPLKQVVARNLGCSEEKLELLGGHMRSHFRHPFRELADLATEALLEGLTSAVREAVLGNMPAAPRLPAHPVTVRLLASDCVESAEGWLAVSVVDVTGKSGSVATALDLKRSGVGGCNVTQDHLDLLESPSISWLECWDAEKTLHELDGRTYLSYPGSKCAIDCTEDVQCTVPLPASFQADVQSLPHLKRFCHSVPTEGSRVTRAERKLHHMASVCWRSPHRGVILRADEEVARAMEPLIQVQRSSDTEEALRSLVEGNDYTEAADGSLWFTMQAQEKFVSTSPKHQ